VPSLVPQRIDPEMSSTSEISTFCSFSRAPLAMGVEGRHVEHVHEEGGHLRPVVAVDRPADKLDAAEQLLVDLDARRSTGS
jgi:hypothetical protein